VAYPNQLYSLLVGFIAAFFGNIRLWHVHLIGALSLAFGNCFWWAALRYYFTSRDSWLVILLTNFNVLFLSFTTLGTPDIASYAAVGISYWSITKEVKSFTLGILTGLFSLLRAQHLTYVLVFPILTIKNFKWKTYILTTAYLLISAYSIIFIFNSILAFFVKAPSSGSSSIVFYISFFKEVLYGFHELHLAAYEFLQGLPKVFNGESLFLLPVGAILVFFSKKSPQVQIGKKLALSSAIVVLLPMIFYGMERLFPVTARYYLTAVPFLAACTLLCINENLQKKHARALKIVLLLFVLSNFISTYQTKNLIHFSPSKAKATAKFLDFKDADLTLNKFFDSNSIVLTNHSFVTGIVQLPKVVLLPDYGDFLKGDNSKIDGIVLVYTKNPDAFIPTSWLSPAGSPPEAFTDKTGNTFQLVYAKNNKTSLNEDSYFFAYAKTKESYEK
jgi:hypothetical protein